VCVEELPLRSNAVVTCGTILCVEYSLMLSTEPLQSATQSVAMPLNERLVACSVSPSFSSAPLLISIEREPTGGSWDGDGGGVSSGCLALQLLPTRLYVRRRCHYVSKVWSIGKISSPVVGGLSAGRHLAGESLGSEWSGSSGNGQRLVA
jgi:hypothetical protein